MADGGLDPMEDEGGPADQGLPKWGGGEGAGGATAVDESPDLLFDTGRPDFVEGTLAGRT